MRKMPILLALICFLCLHISGQQVTNINANQLDVNIVRVAYDLEGEVPGQLFTVRLFNSTNQYGLPLEYVDGYVGERVEAGLNKFIVQLIPHPVGHRYNPHAWE